VHAFSSIFKDGGALRLHRSALVYASRAVGTYMTRYALVIDAARSLHAVALS
jgi:hypothetical protein